MTLFNGNPVDLNAFSEGMQACIDLERTGEKLLNPYPEKSDQWHSWNKGWNSYDHDKHTITIEVTESIHPDIRLATPEELKSREITDFKITEVSLMPDGSYAPGGYFQ